MLTFCFFAFCAPGRHSGRRNRMAQLRERRAECKGRCSHQPRHTGMCRVVIKRQKPLRPRFTRTSRCARRLSRGHSPRKKAPHNVGSWPSLRGLRALPPCRCLAHTKSAALSPRDGTFPTFQNRSVQKPKNHPRRCAANCHHHNGGKDGRQPLPGQTGMIRRDVGFAFLPCFAGAFSAAVSPFSGRQNTCKSAKSSIISGKIIDTRIEMTAWASS